MPTWDPRQYLKFADHRLRPALDLLAQIQLDDPRLVFDLGCGPGNITHLLAERWPGAQVVGIDSSADMLAKARREAPSVTFVEGDINGWTAPRPPQLLFSNAALQWLDGHAELLPRLLRQLAPRGLLAVQMPYNKGAPSHLLMDEAAGDGPWRARLAKVRGAMRSIEPADAYYRILSPIARRVDIWETQYLHVLEGDNPVVEWTKGTGLRPYLDALDESARGGFLAAYAARVAAAYPKQADGRTLLPFRRIFFVAQV
ncbi:MAG: trans-aconitate 2-methyltransferase [Dongiaceae bacterium]